MANINWKSGVNGTFDTIVDWNVGVVPGAADAASIFAAGTYVVTMANAESVGSLTLNAAGATLLDSSGQNLTVGTSLLVNAGLFSIQNGGQIVGPGATVKLGAGGTLLAGAGNAQITVSSVALAGTVSVAGTLGLNGGGTVGGTLNGVGTLEFGTGSFALAATTSVATTLNLLVNGGTLVVGATETLGSPLELIGSGTLTVAKGTLTLSGPVSLGLAGSPSEPGGTLNGPGTLSTTGTVTIQPATSPVLNVTGGLTWLNAGVVNDVGLGGLTGAKVVNQALGTFNVVGDGVSLTADATPGNLFTNAGLLAKTSGTGTSTISVSLVSTGVINVASGTLDLTGGGTIGGVVNGAGTLLLGAGTFSVGATTGTGHIAFGTGEAITFAKTALVAAPLTLGGGVAVTIAKGANATLSGAVTVGDANGGVLLIGPGTVTTTGVTTIIDPTNVAVLDVQRGVTWVNAGTVLDSGVGYFGAQSATVDSGAIVNAATGQFDFAGDDASITLNPTSSGIAASFTNAGTLAKTGGTGTSTLAAVVTSTGSVVVASGTLLLIGGGAVGGALAGAGTLDLGGGAFTTAGISGAGNLAVTGAATLTATGALTAALFVDGYSTLAAVGVTGATLSGNIVVGDANGGVRMSGPGTLTTTGTTTIRDTTNVEALDVQRGVTWVNAGTVLDSGVGYFGAQSATSDSGAIVNAATGQFDFAGDDASITLNPTSSGIAASFTNAGTLAKTGGTGTSTLAAVVTSTGSVVVASGTLLLIGGGAVGGALAGAGTLDLGGGAFTSAGISGAGNLAVTGAATLTATGALTAALFVDGYSTLAAVGVTGATLSGNIVVGDANGGVRMSGPGTLTTTGTTTIRDTTNVEAVDVQRGVTWVNAGTVLDSGVGYFGAQSATVDSGAIVNAATGQFDFAGDDASITLNPTSSGIAASFTNAGTLAKTGGTGTSTLAAVVTSTGSVVVASGTLLLIGGGAVGGALAGAGTLDLGGGAFTSAGISGAGNLAVTGAATLTATGALTAALFVDGYSTLAAVGVTGATLSGNIVVGDANGGVRMSGPGTLTTTGTTTIRDTTNVEAVDVQRGVTWVNAGTVLDSGVGYFGAQSATSDSGAIVNAATGQFDFAGDDASITLNPTSSGIAASFTNAGTLAKTGGTGTSTLAAVVTSTGSVVVASGTLLLIGGGAVGGALAGAGTLDLGGGAFTSAGISGAGNLAVTGAATLTATGALTAALFVDGYSTLAAVGVTGATLSGNIVVGDANGGVRMSGPGTLTTTGTTTIRDTTNVEALDVQRGVTWVNAGTVLDSGVGYFGAQSATVDSGAIVNAATGQFDFAGDDASITLNPTSSGIAASFTNAGTLAKTGGKGVSTISVAVANTGTVEAGSGTLLLAAGVTGAGTLKIDAGATLDVGFAVNTQSVVFAGGHGATLRFVAASQALAGFTSGDKLILAGTTVSAAKIAGGTLTVTAASGTYAFTSAALAGFTAGFGTTATGDGFVTIDRAAVATHTPEPLAFGNRHVGDVAKLALTVGNVATADGYSEKLNATLATTSVGFTAAGAVAGLVGGASNATALSATMSTATVGVKTGTATLTVASNGAGVDGRGTTALAAQTVNLTGAVYAYAVGAVGSTLVSLGNFHVGDLAAATLTVTNTAATGGFSEALDATLGGGVGSVTGTGTVSLLAAGAPGVTGLVVGLNPLVAGLATGSETVSFVSDGSGTSGLGKTAIGTQTINVSGAFYNLATAVASSGTVAFGQHHVNDSVGTQTIKITNGAAAGMFSEALTVIASGTGSVTASGLVLDLAAGASDSTVTVTDFTFAAGAISGGVLLNLQSDGKGIDGLGSTVLTSKTVNVTGANYALASGQIAGTVDFGVIHANTAANATLSLTNTAATGGFSEALDATLLAGGFGLTSTGTISGLAAGVTDASSLQIGLNTGTTGAYTASALLSLVSDGAGIDNLGTTTLFPQVLAVTATVDNYAVASFEDVAGPVITGAGAQFAVNLGSVAQGGAALGLTFGVLNSATGLSDLLGGTVTGTATAGFANTGFGTFSGLVAGQHEDLQKILLSTTTAGTFTETVVLAGTGSNASGYSGVLTAETLTVTGTITPSVFTTYALAAGPNAIIGANGRGDIFVASAGALNSRDQLTGGTGANSVTLVGGGLFDVGAPKVFANIPTLNATEGQLGTATTADTRQTVLLRDGTNETVNVATGKAATGNTGVEATTIYGGDGANTIHLASGADTVFLGTGKETVTLGGVANVIVAGGGTALVQATAANAGASVVGATGGTTTLEVTTAGSVTLNAADTGLTVKLDLAGKLTLSAMGFITAVGSAGADNITAMATGQTLTGGAGLDTLTGYGGGGDTFSDTATGLSGDTVNNWAVGDTIDLTNVVAANLKALTFAAGALMVTDGAVSASIKFGAGAALANFNALGADGHGGTLLGYHS